MEQTIEATIEKRGKWYIGWIDAVPGASIPVRFDFRIY